MKGDFSRDTFDNTHHFTRVLMQQGRVQLDADWNEQQAINRHHTETTARDIIGPCGAPLDGGGFMIGLTPDGQDFTISPGRIYVEGVLCELEASWVDCQFNGSNGFKVPTFFVDGRSFMSGQWIEVSFSDNQTRLFKINSLDIGTSTLVCELATASVGIAQRLRRITTYLTQPDYPVPESREQGALIIVFLDVWQRHLTSLDEPYIREIALGGPDTTTRLKTVWQVRILKVDALMSEEILCNTSLPQWEDFIAPLDGKLSARATPSSTLNNSCLIPPNAGYRGLENQLYRVEIHEKATSDHQATFKWSRDNGIVVSKIESVSGVEVTVSSAGPDDVLGFSVGQTVELVDDVQDLHGTQGIIARIVDLNMATRVITLDAPASVNLDHNPRLKRWDSAGVVSVQSPAGSESWIELENGVEVHFSAGQFKTGDYWLIPARAATADIEWPRDTNGRINALSPHGIVHQYCRLALVNLIFDNNTNVPTTRIMDCRRVFQPLPDAVKTFHVINTSWQNDDVLSLDNFNPITIDFDAEPSLLSLASHISSPATAGTATVIVALEIGTKNFLPAVGLDGIFLTVILDGDVTVQSKTLLWQPKGSLASELSNIIGQSTLRVRVILKGHAIWSETDGGRRYLDGQSFGQAGNRLDGTSRVALGFPSGAGERASDFESWFYLVKSVSLVSVTLSTTQVQFTVVNQTETIEGSVLLDGMSLAGGTIITLSSTDKEAASPPSTVTVQEGENSANFNLIVSATVQLERNNGINKVSITATLNGINRTADLQIIWVHG